VSAITRVRLPRFSARRPGAPRLRRPRPRTLVVVAIVVLLLGGGWLWLRTSSFVSVDRVTVTGVTGPSAGEIRAALLSAARNMTTLDVNVAALKVAVAPFPVVKSLSVSTQFPHGIRIRVREQIPVGAVSVDGRRIPVAADGRLLPAVSSAGLASIPVSAPPGGERVTGAAAGNAVALLAAAPAWLRARVTEVSTTAANGLVATLHDGPQIYFGDPRDLHAKWTAAETVLADAGSQGAVYIDVTVPERPAAGGVAGAATSSQPSTLDAAPTGAASGAASVTSGATTVPAGATSPAGTPATGSPAATTATGGG
jgi:cell division protein FtsQ